MELFPWAKNLKEEIIEYYLNKSLKVEVTFPLHYCDKPYHFDLIVSGEKNIVEYKNEVEKIIDNTIPAFCKCNLIYTTLQEEIINARYCGKRLVDMSKEELMKAVYELGSLYIHSNREHVHQLNNLHTAKQNLKP